MFIYSGYIELTYRQTKYVGSVWVSFIQSAGQFKYLLKKKRGDNLCACVVYSIQNLRLFSRIIQTAVNHAVQP